MAMRYRMSGPRPAILSLIISFAVLVPPVRPQHRFDCEENYCSKKENQCSELRCDKGRIVENATLCGCCGICVQSLDEDADCSNTEFGWSSSLKECGDGLFCNEKGKCEATACLKKVRMYKEENAKHQLEVNFTCDYFGNHDPVVCISDVLCFCVNKQGKRIFGTDFAANDKSMTCDCSRDIAAFPKEVEDETFLPRCLPNGNYDPLQCTEDICFCLDSLNQKDVDNDASSIRTLSCYDNVHHENGRTTKCLKEKEEQMTLFKKNLTVIGLEPIRCDLDGSYFPVQCNPGRCFCVTRNGKIYEDYIIKKRNAKGMTCRCLRDKEILQDRIDSSDDAKYLMQLECDQLGNYKSESHNFISQLFLHDFT